MHRPPFAGLAGMRQQHHDCPLGRPYHILAHHMQCHRVHAIRESKPETYQDPPHVLCSALIDNVGVVSSMKRKVAPTWVNVCPVDLPVGHDTQQLAILTDCRNRGHAA
jgi:hypothetical protein